MKNLFTLVLLFVVTSFTMAFGQRVEQFSGFPERNSNFNTGYFNGENGIIWYYTLCKNDNNSDGLEKAKPVLKNDLSSEVVSSLIQGGVALLKINYATFPSIPVKFDVFVNKNKVATLTVPASSKGQFLSSGNIVVNYDKPFYIRIKQADVTSGSVMLNEITWTKFSLVEGTLSDNQSFPRLSDNGVDGFSSINKDRISNSYRVYPNPAKDYVYIEMSENRDVIFRLFTLAGQMVLQDAVSGSGQKININNLKEGLYIYKILEDKSGKLVSGKMIVR